MDRLKPFFPTDYYGANPLLDTGILKTKFKILLKFDILWVLVSGILYKIVPLNRVVREPLRLPLVKLGSYYKIDPSKKILIPYESRLFTKIIYGSCPQQILYTSPISKNIYTGAEVLTLRALTLRFTLNVKIFQKF